MSLKVSAVSYANTLPFIYGLQQSDIINNIELSLDPPAICAQKLIDGIVDISLVPVAVLPLLPQYQVISKYCIGAEGKVRTVALFSNVPLNDIENIYLDYQSRTSVMLVKVLAKEHWGISPKFVKAQQGFENRSIVGNNAAVVIGDRVFALENQYKYKYDLAEEWLKFTGLPFVFACWASVNPIDSDLIAQLDDALALGVNNINKVVAWQNNNPQYASIDLLDYYLNNISYPLDDRKKEGLQLFLTKLKEI
jgi:chorismate dehydratase